MGEGLKRALVAYKKYRLVKRIIAAFAGAAAGIAGCITYARVYHNYNAAVWAGLSAAFAIVFLHLNFSVRRDYERSITRETFKAYLLVGVLGAVAGLAALITYIVLGATHHEKGNYSISNAIIVAGLSQALSTGQKDGLSHGCYGILILVRFKFLKYIVVFKM